MPKPIGTIGNIDTLTVGGRVLTDLTTLIVLLSSTTGNGNSTTLRAPGVGAGYQVTTGKTLGLVGAMVSPSAAGGVATIGYGDNDVGLNGSTATNPVYALDNNTPSLNLVSLGIQTQALKFSIPALKYPFLSAFAGGFAGFVQVYGYET